MSAFALVVDTDNKWLICRVTKSTTRTLTGPEFNRSPTGVPDGVRASEHRKTCIIPAKIITRMINTEEEAQQIFCVLEQASLVMQQEIDVLASNFRLKLNMVI